MRKVTSSDIDPSTGLIDGWYRPTSWAMDNGLMDLEKALGEYQVWGTALPAEYQNFLNTQAGGGNPLEQWNSFVSARQDQASGSGGLFGIEELDFGALNPVLGGLAMPIGGATGYQAVTGGDIGAGVGLDVAALGAGAGLAQMGLGGADAFAGLGGVEGVGGVGSGPSMNWADPSNWLANAGSMTDVPIQWDAPVDDGWMDVLGGPEGMGGVGTGPVGGSVSAPWYERLWSKYGDKVVDKGLPAIFSAALRGAPAAAGAYGASQQAEAYKELANKYMALGEPSRARYEASFQPGFSMANEPGYKDALALTTKETLHALSPSGNPAGSPNAWQQTLQDVNAKFSMPALNEYRRLNAGAGGLASLTAAAPGAASAGINAEKGVYDALGAGAADIFHTPKSLSDILREMRRAGY
jgi:hypothetical protein